MQAPDNSLDRTIAVFRDLHKLLEPPQPITVTEWSDANRYLPAEAAAEPGRYSSARTPYAREIMNAIGDSTTRMVVFKAASQVSKTEIILNAIGYFSTVDPSPMLWVLPNEDSAKSFSAERLQPTIRDTPAMRGAFAPETDRKRNKVLYKGFRGGYIALVSSETPASLAGRPVRVLLMDEVDRMPDSSGIEGDPVAIASRRTTTFWNKKIVLTSSPTIDGDSRIDAAYRESTQEQWFIPCPGCGHMQVLSFWRLKFDTLHHHCEKCENGFDQTDWQAGNSRGEWRAFRTHDSYGRKLTTRGFHLSSLPSPFSQWSEIVSSYQEAKRLADSGDVNKLLVWTNTVLGETWKETFEHASKEELYERREVYDAELPDGVLYLTAGCDTQGDRIEVTVYGWGKGHECWAIEHVKIFGDTDGEQVWKDLDAFLNKEFSYADGYRKKIDKIFIDSGGDASQKVYEYARYKVPRLFPIKGASVYGAPVIKAITKTSQTRQPLIIIGTDTVKSELTTRLNVQKPGPGYVHFPKLPNGNSAKGCDSEFFRALTSETAKAKFINGHRKIVWVKNPSDPNEAWDCFCYARAALQHSENMALDLNTLERPRFTDQVAKPAHFGTQERPNLQFRPAPAPEGEFVPRWRKN